MFPGPDCLTTALSPSLSTVPHPLSLSLSLSPPPPSPLPCVSAPSCAAPPIHFGFVGPWQHIATYPYSYLTRFLGIYRLTFRRRGLRKEIHFTVMKNIFYTNLSLDLKYDLKGSSVGRRTGPKANGVLKDVDFDERCVPVPRVLVPPAPSPVIVQE